MRASILSWLHFCTLSVSFFYHWFWSQVPSFLVFFLLLSLTLSRSHLTAIIRRSTAISFVCLGESAVSPFDRRGQVDESRAFSYYLPVELTKRSPRFRVQYRTTFVTKDLSLTAFPLACFVVSRSSEQPMKTKKQLPSKEFPLNCCFFSRHFTLFHEQDRWQRNGARRIRLKKFSRIHIRRRPANILHQVYVTRAAIIHIKISITHS